MRTCKSSTFGSSLYKYLAKQKNTAKFIYGTQKYFGHVGNDLVTKSSVQTRGLLNDSVYWYIVLSYEEALVAALASTNV